MDVNARPVKGPCSNISERSKARRTRVQCGRRSPFWVARKLPGRLALSGLVRGKRLPTPAFSCCAFKLSSSRWPLCPFAMSSLTVQPAASAHTPSQRLSDQIVLGPNFQNMGISDTPVRHGQATASYERKLGDTEVSYYLQGRATGVNDMFVSLARENSVSRLTPLSDRYLHLGFRSPKHLVLRPRVRTVWAILRMRHPLLASSVVMRDYIDIRFVYARPGHLITRRSFFGPASIRLRLQKKLLRRPRANLIINKRARMVRAETGILACRY